VAIRILGISAFYHDSAACLVEDGRIVAAAQEERFTRKKHDSAFPSHAVAYCLREGAVTARQLDLVGFYEKPLLKFERLLETYVASAPRGLRSYLTAMPIWLGSKLWLADEIAGHLEGYAGDILFGEHHESHAASAFYPSPFEQAAILTIDGVGEWATSSVGIGRGHHLELLRELRFPHSLGLLYSAFTYFTGFRVNSGEYKLMGLAPYGEPRYVGTIKEHLVDIRDDGSLWMNQEYFTYAHGLTMTGSKFERLFGGPPRQPDSRVTQREMDIARSVQVVTEDVMLKMATFAHHQTGLRDLCLAGGVALNCVGNGRILREGPFEHLWIQPAAGDAGGAIGVALSLWHRHLGKPRVSSEKAGHWERSAASPRTTPRYADGMQNAFLGPRFGDREIEAFIAQRGCAARRLDARRGAEEVAAALADQKVIGLFRGRMEFGPRALGARSIIGDPRSPKMQSLMNLKIKYRESFRPFAPSVMREHVHEWFELDVESPYMLLVAPVRVEKRIPLPAAAATLSGIDLLNVPKSTVPAITHVDYSARIQTVRADVHGFYYDVIDAFHRLTGCPLIVNTSFNVRGEPIVCTPEDAYRCFMRTEMDVLVLEQFMLDKAAQPRDAVEDDSWRAALALD
jgi:carbamoyltransferase